MRMRRGYPKAPGRGDGQAKGIWKSVWENLNRPFVIFVVGTIVAGTFLAVRDASTRCYDELASTEDTLLSALDELLDRRVAFWEEVIAARSLDELKELKAVERRENRSFKTEFKETKPDALERKIYRLSKRFQNEEGELWSPWEVTMTPAPNSIDPSLVLGWVVSEQLDQARIDAKTLIDLVTSLRGASGPNVFRSFQPKCGLAPSLIRVVTGRPGVIGTAFDD
jgi:hypothetical protein